MVGPTRFTASNISSSVFSRNEEVDGKKETKEEGTPVPPFNGLSLLNSMKKSRATQLFSYLVGKKVIDQKAELRDKFKDKPLPPLNDELAKCLRDELFRPFDVKNADGKVIKKVSIGDLLLEFLKNIPEDYEVTEINLIGGYLIYLLLHQSSKYMDDLFDSDFPNEIKEYLKEVTKSKPSDIDIRIKIRHRKFNDLISKKEIDEDLIDNVFLKDLGRRDTISIEKWAPVDDGMNFFRVVVLDGTDIELIFHVRSLREYLFSIDGYYLPIKEFLGNDGAKLVPIIYKTKKDKEDTEVVEAANSFPSAPLQGIIDAVLGLLRAKDEYNIDIRGFCRLISKITKSMSSAQQGLTKILREKLLSIEDPAFYSREIDKSLRNHHSEKPIEQFAYLFNFTHFINIDDDDIQKIWKTFYETRPPPDDLWTKLVIDQIVTKKIPFSEVLATLNAGFYLCLAGDWASEIDIEMDHFEFEKEAFKVRLNGATLQLVHNQALQMSLESGQLELLQSMLKVKGGTEFDCKTVLPHDEPPNLGIFSCFLKQDPATCLRSLLLLVKSCKNQAEIDLAAKIALSIIVKNVKGDNFISKELVELITKTSDQKIAQELMTLGRKKNLIKIESQERSLGWLHFLKKHYEKHKDPIELFDRYKKIFEKKEILPIPEVIEFYTDVLKDQVLKQPFEQIIWRLSISPMNEDMRQRFIADMVPLYLGSGNLESAIKAINTLDEKKEDLLKCVIEYLEKSPHKKVSDISLVEGLFESFPKLSSERVCYYLSRLFAASADLDRKQEWSPNSNLLKRLFVGMQQSSFIPTTAIIDRVVCAIENKYSLTSACPGLSEVMEKTLPKFISLDDGVDINSYFQLLQAIKKTYFIYKWSDEDIIKIDAIWVKIGQEALASKNYARVVECVEEIRSFLCSDFLLKVADFFIEKNKIDEAIKTLEKCYSLDKSALEQICMKFGVCIKNIQAPNRRATILINSTIAKKVTDDMKAIVKHEISDLLQTSKQSKRLTMIAFKLISSFKNFFDQGNESLLLDFLKAMKKNCPENLTTAWIDIDSLMANDSDLQQEARLLALPKLLQEKNEVIFQFITGEKVLKVASKETVKEIDKVAFEIIVNKTPQKRRLVLESLYKNDRLYLKGKIMLFNDYLFSDNDKDAQEGFKILSNIIQNDHKFLVDFLSSPKECKIILRRLINHNDLPVGLILHLMQFMERPNLKEVNFLPLIKRWVKNKEKIKLSTMQLVILLNIVDMSQKKGDELAKEDITAILDSFKVVESKDKSILNDSSILYGILQIYLNFSNKLAFLEPHKDDFFWRSALLAISPEKCKNAFEIFKDHYEFIFQTLKKREKIDEMQVLVINKLLVHLPILLMREKRLQALDIPATLEALNKKSGKPDTIFEWYVILLNSIFCTEAGSDYGLLYFGTHTLKNQLIPRFYYQEEAIISLIEKFLDKVISNASDVDKAEYIQLYKSLFQNCLKAPNSSELFGKICKKVSSVGKDEKNVCRSNLKRMMLSTLFDTFFNNLLTGNTKDVLTNDQEYEKCGILISFVYEIINRDWFLQKADSLIYMVELMLPYLGYYFAREKTGYDEKSDLLLNLLKFIKRMQIYVNNEDEDNNELRTLIYLPEDFKKKVKNDEKVPLSDIMFYYTKKVGEIVTKWTEIVKNISNEAATEQAKQLPDLAINESLSLSFFELVCRK